jgi:uncharacterized membrane protein YcaP (DUF421 family)
MQAARRRGRVPGRPEDALMLDLAAPWWEFPVRALIVYVVLLVLIRLSGKRTVGQFTPFDLVLVIIVGESLSGSLTAGDESLVGGLIAAATLIALNFAMAIATARSRTIDRLVEGHPVLVASGGKVFWDELKRQKLSESEFREAMRAAKCLRESDIRYAVLEPGGEITIIPRQKDGSGG